MSWLNRLLGKQEQSGAVAKNRLKMVLMHDRAGLSPGLIELIKDDIIAAIVKHVEIDPADIDIEWINTATESRMVAEIPLDTVTRR